MMVTMQERDVGYKVWDGDRRVTISYTDTTNTCACILSISLVLCILCEWTKDELALVAC